MTFQKLELLLLTAILFATTSGCGGGGPTKYTVTGGVKFRGQEVADGKIIFAPQDDVGPSSVSDIVQGRYTIETTAGNKIIRVTATKETGRMIKGAMNHTYAETVDIIPRKYNRASTLVRTVDPATDLVINFDLE